MTDVSVDRLDRRREVNIKRNQLVWILIIVIEAIILIFVGRNAVRTAIDDTFTADTFDLHELNGNISIADSELIVNAEEEGGVRYGYPIRLLSGSAYEIELEYELTDYVNNKMYIQLISDGNDKSYLDGDVTIKLGEDQKCGRVYVPMNSSSKEVQFQIVYGKGDYACIKSIHIEEKKIWVWFKIIVLLSVFFILDILFYKRKNISRKKYSLALMFVGLTILSSLPFLTDFNYFTPGHDLDFHLERIASVAKELSYGNVPVRYYSDIFNGYGYESPMYYGDIFLYIPAMLYNCMLPLYACYNFFVIFINAITLFVSYIAFSKISKSTNIGVLGSFLYTFGAYRICCLTVRAAVGEYVAMVFIPLIIYAMYQILNQKSFSLKNAIILGMSFGGVVLCHTLSMELFVVSLIVMVLMGLRGYLTKAKILTIISGAGICILLTSWWIIPFLQRYFTANVKVLESDFINDIQDTGTYLIQLINPFYALKGWSRIGTANDIAFSLGGGAIVALIAYIFLRVKQDTIKLGERFYPIKMFTQAGCLLAFMSSVYFPWRLICNYGGDSIAKIVGFIEFSWRYLGMSYSFLIFALILIIKHIKEEKIVLYKYISIAACVLTLIPFLIAIDNYAEESDSLKMHSDCKLDVDIPAGEYFPVEAIIYQWDVVKSIEVIEGEATISDYIDQNGEKSFDISTTQDKSVIVCPVYAYENIEVIPEDKDMQVQYSKYIDGRLKIETNGAYDGHLTIKYITPAWWRILELLSAVAFVASIIYLHRSSKIKNVEEQN